MTTPTEPTTRARHPRVQVLTVQLNNREVGILTRLPDDRVVFTFDESYREDSNRPILSLSFKTTDGGVASEPRPTRVRVPPFFSNLLPEGHLRRYLAQRAGVHQQREFFLLWLLGQDLPGAVIVEPADGEELPPASAAALRSTSPSPHLLRFSLAGVQLKFSAVMEADGGLTIPVHGTGGRWIVKLPSPRYPNVPENEFVMMELARASGLDVPETRLIPAATLAGVPDGLAPDGQVFAIRRFDRESDGSRVHTEDFAQVFNVFPHRKYQRASHENLARVIWAEAGEAAMVEFARRLAFSALIGNADMHLKNWSLIYRDPRQPALAPAYDFVATVPYLPDDPHMALSLGGTKRMDEVSLDLFARFAARAGLPERPVIEAVRETTGRLLDAWSTHEVVGMLPPDLRSRVDAHMKTVPLASEST